MLSPLGIEMQFRHSNTGRAYIQEVDALSVQHPLILSLVNAVLVQMGGL